MTTATLVATCLVTRVTPLAPERRLNVIITYLRLLLNVATVHSFLMVAKQC